MFFQSIDQPASHPSAGIGSQGVCGGHATCLQFSSFGLERLSQHYRRLDETTYCYESAGGQFVAELKVDRSGLVIDYPGIWQAEALSDE